MISPDLEAQILRYYHAEKWLVGTVARQLRIHPDTVNRVLAQAGLERHRDQRNQPPPVAVDLPEHVRARDVIVQTHALESYDQLKGTQDEPS